MKLARNTGSTGIGQGVMRRGTRGKGTSHGKLPPRPSSDALPLVLCMFGSPASLSTDWRYEVHPTADELESVPFPTDEQLDAIKISNMGLHITG